MEEIKFKLLIKNNNFAVYDIFLKYRKYYVGKVYFIKVNNEVIVKYNFKNTEFDSMIGMIMLNDILNIGLREFKDVKISKINTKKEGYIDCYINSFNVSKINDKKLNKLIRIIIGLVILIVVIIQGNLFDNVSNATASINDSAKSDKIDAKVKENFSVSFIDVGQADSVLIRNGNYNMLIDAGNNEDGEKLVNYFKSLGIEEFTYVFATHPHEDHIGGMDDIINNFKIDNYYMSNKLSTTKTFMDVLDALDGRNLKYTVPNKGDTLKLGDANIKVIYPGDDKSNINDSSIVLKITYGKNSFLLTGDATSNVERKIYNEDIKSDVLKVAHHGSSYSSTDVFLDRVKPYYAVISVGKNNIYNHPSNKTLEKLNKRNIKVYRTDLDGTIVFISDGDNLSVQTLETDTNG